jgi:hypothetical protein
MDLQGQVRSWQVRADLGNEEVEDPVGNVLAHGTVLTRAVPAVNGVFEYGGSAIFGMSRALISTARDLQLLSNSRRDDEEQGRS